jgi:hypothetical protein
MAGCHGGLAARPVGEKWSSCREERSEKDLKKGFVHAVGRGKGALTSWQCGVAGLQVVAVAAGRLAANRD